MFIYNLQRIAISDESSAHTVEEYKTITVKLKIYLEPYMWWFKWLSEIMFDGWKCCRRIHDNKQCILGKNKKM